MGNRITFRRFLEQRQHDNNRIGDIARDALSDIRMECFTGRLTPESLREHIEDVHPEGHSSGAMEALDAAEDAWWGARGEALVSIPAHVVERALRKARVEYVRAAEDLGRHPGNEGECWVEFELLADYL